MSTVIFKNSSREQIKELIRLHRALSLRRSDVLDMAKLNDIDVGQARTYADLTAVQAEALLVWLRKEVDNDPDFRAAGGMTE